MIAAHSGNPEAVKILLRAKCSVDLADPEGKTALFHALPGGNEEVIRLLLMAGASVTHHDAHGITPLHHLGYHMTAAHDLIELVVEMLVIAGADLEAKDDIGNTPVIFAIMGNNVEAARCLVEAGCPLSSYNINSENLLCFASTHASLDMLEYLCGLGLCDISPYQKDYWGFTPWDSFLYALVADEWELRGNRKPTLAEQRAFVALFQGARDRYLQHDICVLGQILSAMRKQDATAAREDLALLVGRETNWQCYDRAAWYRAVSKRVQSIEWDFAMEDVEEVLMDMKKELNTPVWKFPSKWGSYLWGEDYEDCIIEKELIESDWSSEEDLMEDEVPAVQDQDG